MFVMSHPHLLRYKLNLQDYHRMIEVGILSEDEHVELIHGEIICMSPKGSKHSACLHKIDEWIMRRTSEHQFNLRKQDPVQIPEISEPEPDIVLVPYKENYYADAHPLPEEVILLIEVADSSVGYDRHIKIPLYAAAGIQDYWIINLPNQQIEIHSHPVGDLYKESRILQIGESIMVPGLDMEVQVEDWLI